LSKKLRELASPEALNFLPTITQTQDDTIIEQLESPTNLVTGPSTGIMNLVDGSPPVANHNVIAAMHAGEEVDGETETNTVRLIGWSTPKEDWPYGMPPYEQLRDHCPNFAIQHYDDDCSQPFHASETTGKRVSMFMIEHVYMSEQLKAQNRYLSCPDKETKFMNERHAKTVGESTITSILAKNRSKDGLYARAHKFQRESMKKWKGEHCPAQLLTLPLSFDDETKTEECGRTNLKITILILERKDRPIRCRVSCYKG
jgi:hypothetical protein